MYLDVLIFSEFQPLFTSKRDGFSVLADSAKTLLELAAPKSSQDSEPDR